MNADKFRLMSERHFPIRFNSGGEQLVTAEQAIVDQECLIFLNARSELAALFDLR